MVKGEQISPSLPPCPQVPASPELVQLSRELVVRVGRMERAEAGYILLQFPSDARDTLGDDWAENLDSANLQQNGVGRIQ